MADSESAGFTQVPLLLFIRGLTAVLLVMGVVVGAHYFLGVRLINDAGFPAPVAAIGWVVLWGMFGSIVLGFLAGRVLPRAVGLVLQWLGFMWMGCFGVLLSTTLAVDFGFFVAGTLGALGTGAGRLEALIILGIAVPALVWGFLVARGVPTLERITVEVPGLHASLDGLRIVQLSDVHIGETLGKAFLERVVAQVNALKPDLVALTGDLVDGSVARLRDEVAAFGLFETVHGVFYVTGNHEYYHGGPAWAAHMASLDVQVLHNEHRVISKGGGQLVIGGVPDLEGGRFSESHRPDAGRAFDGAPDAPRILLAHQPRFARQAQDAKVALQLSGHTHGGQIFPFMFFVKLQQPVIAGFKKLWGVPVYTSRGTGYWGPPFRIGPSGEVTEITLKAVVAGSSTADPRR